MILLPNFGAEAKSRAGTWPKDASRRLALSWAALFPREAGVLGLVPVRLAGWLEKTRERAAFPWLDEAGALVPWLSTREAMREASARGARVLGPPAEVAWRVSDKAWAQRLAQKLELSPEPFRSLVHLLDPDALGEGAPADLLRRLLARFPPSLESYTLQPRYGSSGRGRVAGKAPFVSEPVQRSRPRLAAAGGAVLEPWTPRALDLSVQLLLSRDGAAEILGTTRQLLCPAGLYEGNQGVLDEEGRPRSGTSWDAALLDAAQRIDARLREEGFFGP